MTGRLIVLEGIDGSGLSTQSALLSQHLREVESRAVYLTKEPTDGPAGAQVRLALRGRLRLDDATLALLFAADRLDHLATDIMPRLQAGIHVISDRYYLSSLAYQSLSLATDWLRSVNARARRPDVTLFLDVPVDVAMRRLKADRWQLELFEDVDKLRAVRDNYLRLIDDLRKEGEEISIVPGCVEGAERSIEEVAQDIRLAVRRLIVDGLAGPSI